MINWSYFYKCHRDKASIITVLLLSDRDNMKSAHNKTITNLQQAEHN